MSEDATQSLDRSEALAGETTEEGYTMPEGCRCGLKWRIPDDAEGFTWNYLTVCPVAPKDHGNTVWRPYFATIIASGSGGGQAPGGGRIIINDGKVCDPCAEIVSRVLC